MTNSFKENTKELTEIKNSLLESMEITKQVPQKVDRLLNEVSDLKQSTNALRTKNKELEDRSTKLEAEVIALKDDFAKKLESSENRIVSLQRELELSKDDMIKLKNQIEDKNERIRLLESQKEELTSALRQKSI
ncbi:hypothetical protein [Candidatus Hodarchaeum mangrovi]